MSIGNCIVNGLLLKRSLGFLAVLLLAATAVAEKISMYTTNGTDGVSGHVTADNNGYFGGTSINLKNTDELTSYTRKGYIRMDITNKTFEAKTAYLDLVVSLTDPAYSSYSQTINIYGLTDESLDSWDSSTTTWNNAPGNDSSSPTALDPSKTVFLGSFKVATSDTGKTKRLANGDLVDFLNDDTNGKVTFILCRPVETWSGYNLVLSGDANSTYAPPKLTISSEITTLTGSDGDAGYVQGDNTGSFGGAYIRTKNSGSINNYSRKGYVRMDITSIDFSVSSAYLDLTVAVDDAVGSTYNNQNQILKVYGLTDQSLDDWDTSATIWNNAPGNDTTSSYKADTNNTVFLGDITVKPTVDPGSVVRLISSELVDFLNSDTNGLVTFIIGRVNDDQGDGGWGNLISAGGYNTTYDPPTLGASPNISGTVQVGDDKGFFPSSGWHVKNAGIANAVTRKGYARISISTNDLPLESAQLDVMLSLVDDSDYFGNNQIIKVYGLTDQSLDNWDPSTTTWSTAPANDTSSTYAPDLSKATYLGDITVTPSDEAGDAKSLSNQNLVSFLNSDTNGLVTFIFGRYTGNSNGGGQNLLFAGELSTVYDAPFLTVVPKGPPEGTLVIIY